MSFDDHRNDVGLSSGERAWKKTAHQYLAALLAAKDYVERYDAQGYTKLGDLKALNDAREALRVKLKECGL